MLGKSREGEVLLGIEMEKGEEVAVKCLKFKAYESEEDKWVKLNEVGSLHQLRHPGII